MVHPITHYLWGLFGGVFPPPCFFGSFQQIIQGPKVVWSTRVTEIYFISCMCHRFFHIFGYQWCNSNTKPPRINRGLGQRSLVSSLRTTSMGWSCKSVVLCFLHSQWYSIFVVNQLSNDKYDKFHLSLGDMWWYADSFQQSLITNQVWRVLSGGHQAMQPSNYSLPSLLVDSLLHKLHVVSSGDGQHTVQSPPKM